MMNTFEVTSFDAIKSILTASFSVLLQTDKNNKILFMLNYKKIFKLFIWFIIFRWLKEMSNFR